MLREYWNEFLDIKVAEEYYFLYIHHSERRYWAINALGVLMSCTGIFTWISENLSPMQSSLIILAAQIICVLQPFYPFGERRYAATCIYQELRALALKAEQTINQVQFGSKDEGELPSALDELQRAFSSIESRFASPNLFPRNMRLHEAAQKNVAQELENHFDLGDWKYE